MAAKEVSLRFSTIGFLDKSRIVTLATGDEVKMYERRSSTTYKLRLGESRTVNLYQEGAQPKEEDIAPLCSVKIPANCKSANVLLVPLYQKKRYNAIVLDDATFPMGGVYMMNATSHDVGLNFGGEEKMIKSQRSLAYPYELTKPQNVRVELYRKARSEWKKFYTAGWRIVPQKKEIMFLYQNPGSKVIRVKGVVDY